MIPILYESTETAFTSNGLGRLRDCISAQVVEERNGVYELDFEYPVTGSNFDEITLGRIIGVTHDEADDVQPFDIVSYSKPIDGVVTFHCVHISYRQSFLTVTASSINTLSDAFTALGTTTPANPFTYSTDKASTGYCACLDGTPRSVRQVLGGIEGSILDAYGGEYEWDKFDVILHSARGEARDFAIRYGVNMLSFNDEMDSSETYSSVIPYWTDGTTTVIGDEVASGETTVGNHGECVPLDVSDKFENQPSKANVETMAASLLASNDPHLPTQTIKVEFVRLQDLGFAEFSNLLECKLCDSIKVIFPDYNMSGQFKIVKTVWDVLLDRYDSMELGALSGTLSDALGIQSTLGSSGGGGSTFQNMWYATCSTGSGTTAKVASTTTTGFTLSTGNMVRVKFTNANTAASPTLNVDGTGAIAIKKYGTTASMAYMWYTGEVVDFVYDGTNFVMSEGGLATTTYYGVTKLSSSTSSTSTSLAATPSAVKSAYDLAGTKSTVSVTQTLASGTEIGSIDVDGTPTKLYAPTPNTVDAALDSSSTNPVQNKAIYSALGDKADSSSLAAVATTGDYSDLTGKPTIPTVNNATLTIQKNGTDVQTFTANSSTNKTANIAVPVVTVTQTLASGTEIGSIDIDGTATKLYAPSGGGGGGSGTITEVQANGTSVATSGVANIPAATTSAYGVTKLSSSTSSTSTTLAATASAVRAAYNLANGKMDTPTVITSGNWEYITIGTLFIGACTFSGTLAITSKVGSVYQTSSNSTIALPVTLSENLYSNVAIATTSYNVWSTVIQKTTSSILYRANSAASRSSASYTISAITIGIV